MSQTIQTREHHVRYDPTFHFFLAPVTFGLLVWSFIRLFRGTTATAAIICVGLLVLMVLVFKVRAYSLKVQDRVIRLEERLRLQSLATDALRPRILQLSESQLIALRFASDAEVTALALKALEQKLTAKQIKSEIQNWRGDYWRV